MTPEDARALLIPDTPVVYRRRCNRASFQDDETALVTRLAGEAFSCHRKGREVVIRWTSGFRVNKASTVCSCNLDLRYPEATTTPTEGDTMFVVTTAKTMPGVVGQVLLDQNAVTILWESEPQTDDPGAGEPNAPAGTRNAVRKATDLAHEKIAEVAKGWFE